MNWLTSQKTRSRAVIIIWIYDTFKFFLLFKLLRAYQINPYLFFFLDMVTVPLYVKGWMLLISSLTDRFQKFGRIVRWSILTFFTSTAPYLYAAWTGRHCLPCHVWIILVAVILFPLAKIVRTVFLKA